MELLASRGKGYCYPKKKERGKTAWMSCKHPTYDYWEFAEYRSPEAATGPIDTRYGVMANIYIRDCKPGYDGRCIRPTPHSGGDNFSAYLFVFI